MADHAHEHRTGGSRADVRPDARACLDAHGDHSDAAAAAETVKDPVCGMDVDPRTSKHRAHHDGKAFHFCSGRCKAKFETDPRRYLADRGKPVAESTPDDALYTCPMHPEIRHVGPG